MLEVGKFRGGLFSLKLTLTKHYEALFPRQKSKTQKEGNSEKMFDSVLNTDTGHLIQ